MIQIHNLSVSQGDFSLQGIHLEVGQGEYAVLMGKTGSGKTTLLEAICGLRPIAGGQIRLGGVNVTHHRPAQRCVGYVPQDAALFSTMTVRQHLAFALVVRGRPPAEIDSTVEDLAKLLGLGHLLQRRPQGLSGGESQRVALGRALAFSPPVLCLDEPLSALDDATREEMYNLLQRVQQQTGVTALHITHSLSEAERLADRVFLIRDRQVQQLSPNQAS